MRVFLPTGAGWWHGSRAFGACCSCGLTPQRQRLGRQQMENSGETNRQYRNCCLYISSAVNPFSWGPEGHEIVAALAQTHLNDGAQLGIQSLIGDRSLASTRTGQTKFDQSGTRPTTGSSLTYPRMLWLSPTSAIVFCPPAGARMQLPITTIVWWIG